MRFDVLHLRNFRNLATQQFEPSPRFNVIAGANGQGKTNLIEAIYLLSTLRSFRKQKNSELIHFDQKNAQIIGSFLRAGMRREATLLINQRNKQIRLNGKPVQKISSFFGTLNIVLFSPDDMSVLRSGPEKRRLFFDRMIFQVIPAYATETKDYEKALKSRNRLLKSEQPDRTLIQIYEEQLVRLGWKIMTRRRNFISKIENSFQTTFFEIYDENLAAELVYKPNLEANEENYKENYTAAFEKAYRRDSFLGYTSVGPHRDDFDALLDGKMIKIFGSQGQQRAFTLALKIAELRILHDHIGDDPILLLDDVSSELDAIRNKRLFNFLAQREGQVFITTTDPEYVRLEKPKIWQMKEGILS